jgi:aldehyde dehydrogenase (NAD+)
MKRHLSQLIIGGRWVDPSTDHVLEVVDPSTEEVVITVPEAARADLQAAVDASLEALADGGWASAGVAARAEVIERAADIVAVQAAEIGKIMTEEMGAPLTGTVGGHVAASAATMRELAALARKIPEREIRTSRGPDALMLREPIGVVAALTPWNGPFATAVNKAVAALLMGNPVICKPSPQSPLDVFLLATSLAEAGLPDGLISILPAGPEVSAALVAHPDVSAISFTGSSAVGREIGRVAGERFARVQLELGGKSAAVVLDDADPEAVAKVLRGGVFRNAGQVCTALTRVVVPRARHEEFTVESMIARALAEGASIACGGVRPAAPKRGFYFTPTVLRDVTNDMAVAQEEIFGPVTVVIAHDGDEDAIRIANDSRYGLHGAVFTADDDRALAVAGRVKTGTFSINSCVNNPTAPFGGVKQSGIGREHDIEGLLFYSELKTVNLTPALAAQLRVATPLNETATEGGR